MNRLLSTTPTTSPAYPIMDMANTIRIATIGDSGSDVAQFNTGTRQIPILVRLSENVRNHLTLMAGLRVPSTPGAPVPLGAVADVVLATGAS